MQFYIILALFTTLCMRLANNTRMGGGKNLFLLTAVLVPSIIGGFRDLTIGDDLDGYGTLYFEIAQSYNSYFQFIADWETKEYAYATLCYLGKIINNDIYTYLFLSELIKMALVVKTAWHFKNTINPCLVVFVYMLFAYWLGLSMMRQSLALCCCFYSLTYFWDKRFVHFVIFVFIGYLFHNSTIFFLYLPLIEYIYNKTKHPLLLSTIGIVVLYSSALSAFIFLASTGLVRVDAVELYLDTGVAAAKANILISSFMLAIPLLFRKYENRIYGENNRYWFFLVKVSSGLSLMFLFLSSYFEIAFRMSFYMMYVMFIAFPIVLKCIQKRSTRKMLHIVYVVLIVMYYVANANHGLADTIPYSSKILGL